jgi:phosphomannomutase
MSLYDLKFGTDGWRAIIGDQFTFDNVRLVCDAIGFAASSFDAPEGVLRDKLVVGYDRRFLSRDFAYEAALTLSKAGFDVLLSDSPIPSQTVSFTAKKRNYLGGVVITASHNPASYNGIKFKGWYGGSALPEMYRAIEDSLGQKTRKGGGSVQEADLLTDYIEELREFVDAELIRDANVRILHDPIHGVSAGLPARILGTEEAPPEGTLQRAVRRTPYLRTVRGEENPSFGGVNPEPIEENLGFSQSVMRAERFDLAICNDGDSDRLGILDENGAFVSPHKIIALLALYLVRTRGMRGEIVKTFSTTRLIEKIAQSLGVPMHETAIGFKYVADLMLTRPIVIGGEESGGIGFGHFLPERDGILSGLLVAECIAAQRKPLSEIIAAMEEEFGALYYERRDLRRTPEACERLIARVRAGELDALFGATPAGREEKDGVKVNFTDGGWILFRKSGTEPLIRVYCESPNPDAPLRMLDIAVAELDRAS